MSCLTKNRATIYEGGFFINIKHKVLSKINLVKTTLWTNEMKCFDLEDQDVRV